MTASSNPFQRGFRGWCTLVHQNNAAGGENGSNMVGMCVSLSLASQKPSEQKFFVPAGTDLGVKLLHPHSPTEVPLLTSRRCPATNALCVEKHRRASEGRLFLHCIFLSSTTYSYSLWFIVVLQRQAPRRQWYALPIFPADTPSNGLPSAAVTVVVISSPIKWSKVTMFLRTIRVIDPKDAARGKFGLAFLRCLFHALRDFKLYPTCTGTGRLWSSSTPHSGFTVAHASVAPVPL